MRLLLGRWLMLAILAFGVVVMHHAPLMPLHDSGSAMAPPTATDAHPTRADQAMPAGGNGEQHEVHGSFGAADEGSDAGMEHGWLHLCMAILTAVTASVLASLLLRVTLVLRRPSTWMAIEVRMERPPPLLPAPRRLALLCVLRL